MPKQLINYRIEKVVTPADLDSVEAVVKRYYEDVGVVVLDSRSDLEHYDIWLARSDGEPVGCIFLRDLPQIPGSGEVKRMYVDPAYRGQGIGQGLLDALEQHARSLGLSWLYLDTREDLKTALSRYVNNGYVYCDRYNNNQEVTIFMRKQLR